MTVLDKQAKSSALTQELEHSFVEHQVPSIERMSCRVKRLHGSLYSVIRYSIVALNLLTLVYLELGFLFV